MAVTAKQIADQLGISAAAVFPLHLTIDVA